MSSFRILSIKIVYLLRTLQKKNFSFMNFVHGWDFAIVLMSSRRISSNKNNVQNVELILYNFPPE